MCLMLLKKKEQTFSPDYIEAIYDKGNRDGFGMAYVEGERNAEGKLVRPGRVKVVKSMGHASVLKELYGRTVEENPQAAILVHLRNATAGDKTIENCHPYKVLSIDDGDPIDLVMFHNGTIRDVQLDKSMSDSWNFATTHLQILKDRPSMLNEEAFRYFLCWAVGTNKLMFLDNRERVTVINYELGSIHAATGVWLSSRDSLQPPKAYVPPATEGRAGFQLGAGPERPPTAPPVSSTTESGSDTPSVVTNRGYKMTWKQPEGSKWVMEVDGRSHFIPKGMDTPADSKPRQLSLPASKEEEKEYIQTLIKESAPPTTIEDLEALRGHLAKADQIALNEYATNFPVETAHLLKYLANTTELLPEFESSTIEDMVAYCIITPWHAGYALAMSTRVNTEVHEIN